MTTRSLARSLGTTPRISIRSRGCRAADRAAGRYTAAQVSCSLESSWSTTNTSDRGTPTSRTLNITRGDKANILRIPYRSRRETTICGARAQIRSDDSCSFPHGQEICTHHKCDIRQICQQILGRNPAIIGRSARAH